MLCYGQEGFLEDKGSVMYECWFIRKQSTWGCPWQPAGIGVQTYSKSAEVKALYSCHTGLCLITLSFCCEDDFKEVGLSCPSCWCKRSMCPCTPPWKWLVKCLWCELTHEHTPPYYVSLLPWRLFGLILSKSVLDLCVVLVECSQNYLHWQASIYNSCGLCGSFSVF